MEGSTKIDQVVLSILERIRVGLLSPGQRLRSIREEAAESEVGKNTVVEAYLRLVAQGVLVSRPGAGYYVSRVPGNLPQRPFSASAPSRYPPPRTALLTEQLERNMPIRPGDGRLPPKWLDTPLMRRPLMVCRLNADDTYNAAWGLLPLRNLLVRVMGERGINVEAHQVLTTYGANHALDLVIRLRVKPGDVVMVDDPGYYPLFWKLEQAGAVVIGVKRNHDGPDLLSLRHVAEATGARILFTQSLAHNPTGGSITLGIAYGVLKIAEEFDFLVVEDDPFADILPMGAVRLAALDQLSRVIYIGSFSKTLPGSVRVGYIAAQASLAQELNDLKILTIISTSAQNEQLVHSLIEGAQYLKYLRKLREYIRVATLETVQALEGVGCHIERPLSGGYYLWVGLPADCSPTALAVEAQSRGIFLATSDAFTATESQLPKAPAMRVNVAYGAHPDFVQFIAEVFARA